MSEKKEILLIYNRLQQLSVIFETFFKYYYKMGEYESESLDFRSEVNSITMQSIIKKQKIHEEFIEEILKSFNDIGTNRIKELRQKNKLLQEEHQKHVKKILVMHKTLETDKKLWKEEMDELWLEIKEFMESLVKKIDKKKKDLENNLS